MQGARSSESHKNAGKPNYAHWRLGLCTNDVNESHTTALALAAVLRLLAASHEEMCMFVACV